MISYWSIKKLFYATEKQYILNTETNVSTLTSDLRGSIFDLMDSVKIFCEDLKDSIHANHEVVGRTDSYKRQSLVFEKI